MKSVVVKAVKKCEEYSTYALRLGKNIKSGLYINEHGVVVLVPKEMRINENQGLPIVIGGTASAILGETLCSLPGPWTYMDSQSTVTLSNDE